MFFRKSLLVVCGLMSWMGASASDSPVMVAFDLGKTLIGHNSDLTAAWYLPGAHEYLLSLREKGLKLGLIVNYPADVAPTREERIEALKEEIAKAWKPELDPTGEREFDWSLFDVILVPPIDGVRKPHSYLFREVTCFNDSAPVLFMGEDAREIQVARSVGMAAYEVGKPDQTFYLQAELAEAFTREHFRAGMVDCSVFPR